MIRNLIPWVNISIRNTLLDFKNFHHRLIPQTLFCNVKLGKHYSTSRAEICYKKIRVFDCDINYVEMEGNPEHVVFIAPGALSSIEQDFIPLLQNLDPNKFKVIAYDPPGYGGSRPPNRWEIEGVIIQHDAMYATELLQKLGHEKYSLLGWSMGAFSTTIMATTNPERVTKLVVWGMGGYFDDVASNSLKMMASIGISCIPQPRRTQLLNMYGEEDLKKIFDQWVSQDDDETIKTNLSKDGPYTKQYLNQLVTPTLIIQGGKDGFIAQDQIEYLHRNIKGSQAQLIPNGNHATHGEPSSKEFLTIVERFLGTD